MITIIISSIVAFLTTLIITPAIIRFFSQIGIVGIDQHKKEKPILPSSGGICVALGILSGLLSFIGLETFVVGNSSRTVTSLLAIISSVLIVTLIGLFDDLNITSRKVKVKGIKEIRIGLSQWMKPLLTLPAAIPLMVISAGSSQIVLPIIGLIDVGILYPLLFIPVGIVGASNAVNLLGGFNGLEAGMGIIYMIGLGTFAVLTNNQVAILFIVSAAALLAFIKFNWYPAKILPGDSLTYLLGSLLAAGIITGNMERLGIIFMAPFFIEFILKLRSGLKASSLGTLRKDGTIENMYGKSVYSITHVVINYMKVNERQITMIFIFAEIMIVLFGLYLYLL